MYVLTLRGLAVANRWMRIAGQPAPKGTSSVFAYWKNGKSAVLEIGCGRWL
jgi:hypothetical protein